MTIKHGGNPAGAGHLYDPAPSPQVIADSADYGLISMLFTTF